LVRIFAPDVLCLTFIVRWFAEHGGTRKVASALGQKQWLPAKTGTIARPGVSQEEARMLTLAYAARSFSDFTAAAIAAATDDASRSPHTQPRETRDHASYFDTLMRLRCRRLTPRRAPRRY
jgi:hypothetical protein